MHNLDLLQFINYRSVTKKSSTTSFIRNKFKLQKQQKPHNAPQKLNFRINIHEQSSHYLKGSSKSQKEPNQSKSRTISFIRNKFKLRKQQNPHNAPQKLNFSTKIHEQSSHYLKGSSKSQNEPY